MGESILATKKVGMQGCGEGSVIGGLSALSLTFYVKEELYLERILRFGTFFHFSFVTLYVDWPLLRLLDEVWSDDVCCNTYDLCRSTAYVGVFLWHAEGIFTSRVTT